MGNQYSHLPKRKNPDEVTIAKVGAYGRAGIRMGVVIATKQTRAHLTNLVVELTFSPGPGRSCRQSITIPVERRTVLTIPHGPPLSCARIETKRRTPAKAIKRFEVFRERMPKTHLGRQRSGRGQAGRQHTH